MNRRWRFAAIWACCAAAVLCASLAQAEQIPVSRYTGSDLLDACEAQDTAQHAYCVGYIAAIADVVFTSSGRSLVTACIPPTITNDQLVDIALDFLRQHRKYGRSYSAALLVLTAIKRAFPCR